MQVCAPHALKKKIGTPGLKCAKRNDLSEKRKTNTPPRRDMTLVSGSIPKRDFIKNLRSVDYIDEDPVIF
jgi:hypothetical protein